MNEFRLVYGDYYWPEYSSRLNIQPMLLYGHMEITFAAAMRSGVLRKIDKSGLYKTTASCLRILITAETQDLKIAPINCFLQFKEKGRGAFLKPFPEEIKTIAEESGYHVLCSHAYIPHNLKEVYTIYPKKLVDSLQTVSDDSVITGYNLFEFINNDPEPLKTRFSK